MSRVFLGLSLPTISAGLREEDMVIDFWEGGSLLYGSDLMGSCVDYLPMFSLPSERGCLEELCGNIVEVNLEEVVIGDLDDLGSKLAAEPDIFQKNWLIAGPRRGFLPRGGWCRYYRERLKGVNARRLVGFGIASIGLEERKVVTYLGRDILEADEIVSTMPMPYVLRKAGYPVSEDDFPHEPLHVSFFLIKGTVSREPKKVILAKLRYGGIVTYVMPGMPFEGFTSVYHISSARKLKYSGLQERALSDIKRLGFASTLSDIVAERYVTVRYGLLGMMSQEGRDAARDAEEKGLKTLGRLGRWKEMSVCESYLDGLGYGVRTD